MAPRTSPLPPPGPQTGLRRARLWAGPPGRPLFCRWYLPATGLARAGVLLLAPIGFEAQAVGPAYRELAARLVGQGLAVLHLDLYGTGDSAWPAAGGAGEPAWPVRHRTTDAQPAGRPACAPGAETGHDAWEGGALGGWQESVQVGVQLLREAGAARVSVVAMRLAATVAASVASRCQLDGLVLWDPCESGRAYLREQQLSSAVYADDNDARGSLSAGLPAGTEILGWYFSPSEAAAISALKLAEAPGRMAGACLVLGRPGRALKAGARRLEAEGAQWGEAGEQDKLLSVWPLLCPKPEATISAVTVWLAERAPSQPAPLTPVGTAQTVLGLPGASAVAEEVAELGEHRLWGVLARPAAGPRPPTTVVLLNAGRVDHTGPGGLWVGLARSLASQGAAVLRVDLSGLGESPPREGIKPEVVYSPRALDDIAGLLEALPGGSRGAVLAGLCSGAWHSIEAARQAPVRGVAAVNPFFPADRRAVVEEDGTVRIPPAEPVPAASGGWKGAALRLASTLPPGVKDFTHHLRDAKWWWLGRTGRRPRAVLDLRQAVERGADVLVVGRRYEMGLISRGERGTLARLSAGGRFALEAFPGTDHTLLLAGARARVVPVLEEHLLHCATGGAATDRTAGALSAGGARAPADGPPGAAGRGRRRP